MPCHEKSSLVLQNTDIYTTTPRQARTPPRPPAQTQHPLHPSRHPKDYRRCTADVSRAALNRRRPDWRRPAHMRACAHGNACGDMTPLAPPTAWHPSPAWPPFLVTPAASAATCEGPAATTAACFGLLPLLDGQPEVVPLIAQLLLAQAKRGEGAQAGSARPCPPQSQCPLGDDSRRSVPSSPTERHGCGLTSPLGSSLSIVDSCFD